MDADAVHAALRDVRDAAQYLLVSGEPMTISTEGAQDLGHKIRTVVRAYEELSRAYGMVLARLAAQEPRDLL
jgi:hypothetical protein